MQQTPLFAHVPATDPKIVAAPTQTASDAIGKLTPGCRVVGLSKGQVSILDLIEAILWQTGPADVIFSTWTLSDLSIERCEWLIQHDRIKSLALVIDRSFPRCKPDRAKLLVDRFGRDAFIVTRTHAKFALIGNDDWKMCVRTSANLNRNPRFEQFDVDDSPAIYAFFKAHVEELRAMHPEWDQATGRTFAQFAESMGGGLSADYAAKNEGDSQTIDEMVKQWKKRI